MTADTVSMAGDPAPSAQQASSGSSFYAAMRVLPRAQREAMFEVYSFCRQVDDIADSTAPSDRKAAELDQWRADIEALFAGSPPPKLRSLAETVRSFQLRKADFVAVIDGMSMDADADIFAPDLQTLDLYCDRVASAVGRLSVRIFGIAQPDGDLLAHHLGRALQLTNILRDIDEDAELGRLYLPRELLVEAGIPVSSIAEVIAHPALGAACVPLIARAEAHFDEADRIMMRHPRRAVRAPRIMSEIYRGILISLVARGFDQPRARVRTSRARVLLSILRNAFI
jgi:presqualene diphosphate synthase